VSEARRLLRRFAPSYARAPLARTFAASAATAKRLRTKVVLSPEDLPRVVARLLSDAGVSVRVLPPSQGTAETLADEYAALARAATRTPSGPRAFVRAAEPSVVVTVGRSGLGEGRGKGVRSTHLATLVGRALGAAALPSSRTVRFAALASDGVDGVSGTGGAIIDGGLAARVFARLGPSALDRALASFDTGTLLQVMKTATPSAPTGQNLADLHVLLIK
jgi:hydroxypyruvate reductase